MSEQTQNDGLQTVNAETKNKSSLKARVITAVCYVLVWFALTALKWCVPGGWGSLGFDAAFCAVSVIGSYEFMRAIDRRQSGVNCKISTPQRAVSIAFCAVSVPLYVFIESIPQTRARAF